MKRITKRKIKKVIDKHSALLVVLTVIPVLLLMTTGYAVMSTQLSINGRAELPSQNTGGYVPKDEEDITAACEMSISWEITNYNPYNNMYDLNVILSNNSTEEINGWGLKFIHSENITVVSYQSNVRVDEKGIKYLTSYDWSADIPGLGTQTVVMQITTTEDIETIMNNLEVVACGRASLEEGDQEIRKGNAHLTIGQLEEELQVDIEMVAAGDWGGQVNRYKVTITNSTAYTIYKYRGMLWWGQSTNGYACTITPTFDTSRTDQYVIFSDPGGVSLAPGETVVLDMVIYTNDTTFFPDIVVAGVWDI